MKKISHIALGALILIFLSSFINLFFGRSMTPGTKMAHQICSQIGKQLKKKYGLHYMGISEEGPKGKYKCIGLELDYHQLLSRDEGRVLLLNCREDILQAFNSRPEFRPYMDNYPFTGNNITISIYTRHPKNFDVYYPDIAIFGLANDRLEYDTDVPGQLTFFTEEKETLEEARKIVEEQREGKRPFIKSVNVKKNAKPRRR